MTLKSVSRNVRRHRGPPGLPQQDAEREACVAELDPRDRRRGFDVETILCFASHRIVSQPAGSSAVRRCRISAADARSPWCVSAVASSAGAGCTEPAVAASQSRQLRGIEQARVQFDRARPIRLRHAIETPRAKPSDTRRRRAARRRSPARTPDRTLSFRASKTSPQRRHLGVRREPTRRHVARSRGGRTSAERARHAGDHRPLAFSGRRLQAAYQQEPRARDGDAAPQHHRRAILYPRSWAAVRPRAAET